MKIQPMGNAMLKKSVAMILAAGFLVAAQAAGPLSAEVENQQAIQDRWDRLMARAGLEFGMVAEGEYFKSEVDGSLSNPDHETIDKKQSTMIDLRIGARPWDALGGDVVIRFQQDWQTYFSNRSRPIHLRWVQMHGKVSNLFTYTMGDFKEKWSPLTLWAPELDILMEAPIFERARREGMAEEFVGDNNRVLQGAKINAVIPLIDQVEWRIDGYASRIRRAEYLDGVQSTLDASKHPVDVIAKHGSEFGIASDLEQWSLGANTEFLVLNNGVIGGSYLNTFEESETWRPSDNAARADSGYSINGQNWYTENLWATDNRVISARLGADVAGFLGLKNITAQFMAEFAMSGLSYNWLPPANSSTSGLLTSADKAAITALGGKFRTQVDSVIYESHTGVGAFADTLWNAYYTLQGITPPDEKEGNALLADLDLGWKASEEGLSIDLGFRYLDVDSSYYNIMAQSPTFRAERIMNMENDLSSLGVAAPLYSTFDALYHSRAKISPLRNQPYQQAPYMQNAHTHSIGTSGFVADHNLQLLLPFGYATPNRKGIDLDLTASLGEKVKVQGVFSMLDEKVTESGFTDLTSFQKIGGGAMINIASITGQSRLPKLSGGYQLTTADYSEIPSPIVFGKETFSSAMINAGLHADIFKKIALLGGYQRIDESYENSPVKVLQQQWRAGLQYTVKDGSYVLWTVGQIFSDSEQLTLDSFGTPVVAKGDFSQFLTQVKIRAEF